MAAAGEREQGVTSADEGRLDPDQHHHAGHDPEAQAEAILAESDEREADRSAAPSSSVEHRTSDEATEPVD